MHGCEDCIVCLRCGSRPIIEDCKGIRFTPFPSIYVNIPLSIASQFRSRSLIRGQDTTESTRPDFLNMWDQVDDFSWLRAEQSPNWKALQPRDEGTIESRQWELIKVFSSTGDNVSELDDVLRAAKAI